MKKKHDERVKQINWPQKGKDQQDSIETVIKSCKQRKAMAALYQTMLLKIWRNRQRLIEFDAAEKQALDDELQVANELEQEWRAAEGHVTEENQQCM